MNSKNEKIFEDLKAKIVSGEFQPGKRLSEREIGAMYSISRTPIREIMWELANDYLITSTADGYQVRSFQLEDVVEIFNARQAVEGACARLACSSSSQDYLPFLADIKKQLLAIDVTKDPALGDKVGHQLHYFIIKESHNLYLIDFSKRYDALSRFMRNVIKSNGMIESKSKLGHLEIIAAMEKRDGKAAERAMVEHIGQACRETVMNYCNYLLGD